MPELKKEAYDIKGIMSFTVFSFPDTEKFQKECYKLQRKRYESAKLNNFLALSPLCNSQKKGENLERNCYNRAKNALYAVACK